MKAIITKYACTSGVRVIEYTTSHTPTMICEVIPQGYMSVSFHGKDWHTDKESAATEVKDLFARKKKSLEKALARLAKKEAQALSAIEKAEL